MQRASHQTRSLSTHGALAPVECQILRSRKPVRVQSSWLWDSLGECYTAHGPNRRMDMLLEQKTAVIYGAGGAIGSAVARAFAREGARVYLAGRTRPPLEALAHEIAQAGGVAQAASVDAHDTRAVQEHLNAIGAQTGRIDISFNANASKADQGSPLVEMSVDEFTLGIIDAMQTQFVTTTAAARHMLKS